MSFRGALLSPSFLSHAPRLFQVISTTSAFPNHFLRDITVFKGLVTFATRLELPDTNGSCPSTGAGRVRTIKQEASILRPKDGNYKQNKKQVKWQWTVRSEHRLSCTEHALRLQPPPGTRSRQPWRGDSIWKFTLIRCGDIQPKLSPEFKYKVAKMSST